MQHIANIGKGHNVVVTFEDGEVVKVEDFKTGRVIPLDKIHPSRFETWKANHKEAQEFKYVH